MPKRTREQWEESPSPEVSDTEATDSGGGGADSGDMEVDNQESSASAVAFDAKTEEEMESMDLDEEEHEPSDEEEEEEEGSPSQSFDRRWVNEYYPNKDALDPYQGPFMKKRTPFRTHPPMGRLLDWMLDNEDAFNKHSDNRRRLNSLFSDFTRQRETNVDGYRANIAAWQNALVHATKAGVASPKHAVSLLTIEGGEPLVRRLEHKDYNRPEALYAVLQDAVAEKEWIPLDDFLSARTSVLSSSWTISPMAILKWGLKYGLKQLGVIGEDDPKKLPDGHFVLMQNVKELSYRISKKVMPKFGLDLVFSREQFLEEFGRLLNPKHQMSSQDLDVILKFLERDEKVIIISRGVIKFLPKLSQGDEAVTDVDVAIVKLRQTTASLEKDIETLNSEIAADKEKALKLNREGNKAGALSALRSKKLKEATLATRTSMLAQVEATYRKMDESKNSVQIVDVFKTSTGALKGLHTEIGGAEGVDKVIDAKREQEERADEVQAMINELAPPVDNSELEDDLDALTKDVETEEAAKTAAKLAEAPKPDKKEPGKEKAKKEEGQRAKKVKLAQEAE